MARLIISDYSIYKHNTVKLFFTFIQESSTAVSFLDKGRSGSLHAAVMVDGLCGGTAPVRMPELHVGPALTHVYKADRFQYPGNLTGFEYRNIAHNYATTTF